MLHIFEGDDVEYMTDGGMARSGIITGMSLPGDMTRIMILADGATNPQPVLRRNVQGVISRGHEGARKMGATA